MERTKEFQDIIEQAGLDWSVRSETVQTSSGIIIPKAIALVREDTNKVIGTHKESYCMYQNEELLELLFQVSRSTGRKLKGGGSFCDGEKVFFQLESESMTLGTDRIEGSITGINSFDGSTALAFGNSNVTISCRNTFFMAYKTLGTKFRHSATMRPKIEEVLKQITILVEEEKQTFKTIERMVGVQMDLAVRQLVTRMLFDIKEQDKQMTDEQVKELSTRKTNSILKFEDVLNGELNEKGRNLWGLFSGVTKYTTHSMTKKDNSEQKLFGRTGELERQIFNKLEKEAWFV
jgi:phage/plasmid-like protein (TIGR03299 family)